MDFSRGQIIFAIFFIVVFIAGMAWAYRKDYQKNKKYFKGSFLILLAFLVIYLLFFLVVRIYN
ncbi:MAG: hypothetical protein H0X62_08940 [Bacteroidetes bacterium]|nr:hypothetical protein [Bacteroidota bacterium]